MSSSKSRSNSQSSRGMSWDTLKKMAMLPLILYISHPVIFVIYIFFNIVQIYQVTNVINSFNIALIVIWYILCICKIISERRPILGYLKRNPVIIFFGFFNLFIVISTIITHEQRFTFHAASAGEFFFTYMLYAAGYFVCAAVLNSSRTKFILIRMMQIISLIHVVLVYVDFYWIRITALRLRQKSTAISGIFPNRNFYGYYLTIIILLSLALLVLGKDLKWRIFDGICFLANAYTLMRTDTLGCVIAVFVGIIFFVIMLGIVYKRFKLVILIISVVFVGAFVGLFFLSSLLNGNEKLMNSFAKMFDDIAKIINNDAGAASAGSGRWWLWTHTAQYIGERPFFGWGANGIFDRLKEEAGNSRPHNEYLQYAAFFGIPAALCYIAGIVSVYVKGIKKRAELDIYTFAALAASFGYVVSACFGNTMSYTAPYFFIMLGLAVRPCIDISPCRSTGQKSDHQKENKKQTG